jgi:acyl carrier protein
MMGVAVPTDATGVGLDSITTRTLDVSSGETGLEAGRDGTEMAVATEEAGTTTADETGADETGADSYELAMGTVKIEVALGIEATEVASGADTEAALDVEAEAVSTTEDTGRVIMVAAVRTVVPLAWTIVAPAGHHVVVCSTTLVT